MLQQILSYRLCSEKSYYLLADVSAQMYSEQLNKLETPAPRKQTQKEACLVSDQFEAFPCEEPQDDSSDLMSLQHELRLSSGHQLKQHWIPVGGSLDASLTALYDQPYRLLTECFPLLDFKSCAERVLLRRGDRTTYDVILICASYQRLGLGPVLLNEVKERLFDYICKESVDPVSPGQCRLNLELLVLDEDNTANRRWLNELCQTAIQDSSLSLQGFILDKHSSSVYQTSKFLWLKKRYYKKLLRQSTDSLESIVERCQQSIY